MNIELIEPEQTTALTAPQRAAVALSSAQTRADLAELVKKSANIVAVLNADARMECHAAAMALVKARTSIEKVGKAAREDAQAFSRAVIAEEKSLISITAAEEARLLALRNAWDEARAAEKAEAERLERERITKIHLRIADIRAAVGIAQQSKLPECVDLLARLTFCKLDGFEEFTDEATAVLAETTATVISIHAAKVAEEAERQRIKMEQEAERQRMAEERAELARMVAEAKAAQAKVEAEAKALRDAEAAELTRQRDAFLAEVAAANKAQQEARAALEAELSMMRAALAEPAEPEEPVPTPAGLPVVREADDTPQPLVLVESSAWRDMGAVISTAIDAVADRFSVPRSEAVALLGSVNWSAINPELLEQAA